MVFVANIQVIVGVTDCHSGADVQRRTINGTFFSCIQLQLLYSGHLSVASRTFGENILSRRKIPLKMTGINIV